MKLLRRFSKKKPLPPQQPKWQTLDSFILGSTAVITMAVFLFGGVEIAFGLLAGYAVTVGTIIVMFKFGFVRDLVIKKHRWFDLGVLLSGFILAPTMSMMLIITYAGLLFSAFLAVYGYHERKKLYFAYINGEDYAAD